MDYRNRYNDRPSRPSNRPQQPAVSAPQTPSAAASTASAEPAKQPYEKSNPHSQHKVPVHGAWWNKKSIIALFVVAVVIAGSWFVLKWFGVGSPINKNEYQAVFIAREIGGVQAYFGRLQNTDGAYLELEDVYYLQPAPSNSEQQAEDGEAATQPQNNQPQLIRLGQEIHKPHNKMYIKADQVLFWENLQSDSKIMEAIEQAKNAQR